MVFAGRQHGRGRVLQGEGEAAFAEAVCADAGNVNWGGIEKGVFGMMFVDEEVGEAWGD